MLGGVAGFYFAPMFWECQPVLSLNTSWVSFDFRREITFCCLIDTGVILKPWDCICNGIGSIVQFMPAGPCPRNRSDIDQMDHASISRLESALNLPDTRGNRLIGERRRLVIEYLTLWCCVIIYGAALKTAVLWFSSIPGRQTSGRLTDELVCRDKITNFVLSIFKSFSNNSSTWMKITSNFTQCWKTHFFK